MGNILYWCDQNAILHTQDCSLNGEVCGWRNAKEFAAPGYYACASVVDVDTKGAPDDSFPMACTKYCKPDCNGKECGSDGCGGSCGSCKLPDKCHNLATCEKGKCVPGKPIFCDDNNPCTSNSCNPEKGCQFTKLPDSTQCHIKGKEGRCRHGLCQVISTGDQCVSPIKIFVDQELMVDFNKMRRDITQKKLHSCINSKWVSDSDVFIDFNAMVGTKYRLILLSDRTLISVWMQETCNSVCKNVDKDVSIKHSYVFTADRSDVLLVLNLNENSVNKQVRFIVKEVSDQQSEPSPDQVSPDLSPIHKSSGGCTTGNNSAEPFWLFIILSVVFIFLFSRKFD